MYTKYFIILKARSFLFLFSFFFSFGLVAQDLSTMVDSNYYHIRGKHHINLSVGLLNTTDFAFSVFGGSGAGSPSASANLEYMYGLTNDFGIGAHFNFYTVDAQGSIDLTQLSDDIFDDPLCFLACQTGIGLGNTCDCAAGISERVEVYTLAVKGAYHIKRFKHIDTYTSFIAGYSFNRRKTITEQLINTILQEVNIETSVPSFVYAGSLGVRFYLSPAVALYGEYGLGNVHTLRLGATYRFMGNNNGQSN